MGFWRTQDIANFIVHLDFYNLTFTVFLYYIELWNGHCLLCILRFAWDVSYWPFCVWRLVYDTLRVTSCVMIPCVQFHISDPLRLISWVWHIVSDALHLKCWVWRISSDMLCLTRCFWRIAFQSFCLNVGSDALRLTRCAWSIGFHVLRIFLWIRHVAS